MSQVQELQMALSQLRRYTQRASDKIDSARREDLINVMAGVAEVAEIARRLYARIKVFIRDSQSF